MFRIICYLLAKQGNKQTFCAKLEFIIAVRMNEQINLSCVRQPHFPSKQITLLIYAGLVSICLSVPTAMLSQTSHAESRLHLSMSIPTILSSSTQYSHHLSLGTRTFLRQANHTRPTLPRMTNSSLQVSRWYLPDYARDNPANWAPLCHLEADIEKQLPIGIWINWEESDRANSTLPPTANVRLKLFSF